MDEKTLAQLTIHVDRLNKTVYGNGDPGLDELMRSVKRTTDRIEANQQADKRDRHRLLWIVVTGMVLGALAFIGTLLSFGFRQWVAPQSTHQTTTMPADK